MQPREAAIITNYIYYYNSPYHYYEGRHNYLLKEIGWEFLSASGDNDDTNGYFGASFTKGTETAIVHRGTNIELQKYQEIIGSLKSIFADVDDDIAIALGLVPKQYYSAKIFTDTALTITTTRTIIHVGHSLGGALAQLLSIEYKHAAIVFDSPGVLNIAKQLFSYEEIYANNILSYVSGPNIVNTAGEHIVSPIWLHFSTPIISYLSYITYAKFTLDQHSMSNILKQFDSVTGGPQLLSYPQSWPSGFSAGYHMFVKTILSEATKNFILHASSKEEIVSRYNIDIDQIQTVNEHLGFDFTGFIETDFINEYIDQEFIIKPPSKLPPHDNIENIINLFGNALTELIDPKTLTNLQIAMETFEELLQEEDSNLESSD